MTVLIENNNVKKFSDGEKYNNAAHNGFILDSCNNLNIAYTNVI